MIWKLTRWFTSDWWGYLLEAGTNRHPKQGWPGWRKFACRIKDHKAGVWWFNPGGLEPNMHCKNCGDDLG